MWAMMPMFRVLLKGDCLGIFLLPVLSKIRPYFYFFTLALGPHPQREPTLMPRGGFACPPRRHSRRRSPSVVSKGLIGFSHPVRVLALFHRAAAQVRCIEELVRQLFIHGLAVAARAGVADNPANTQRKPAVRVHFDRHLVVAAADAARLHLQARFHVVDRLLEYFERIVAGFLFDDLEALVQN